MHRGNGHVRAARAKRHYVPWLEGRKDAGFIHEGGLHQRGNPERFEQFEKMLLDDLASAE